MKIISNNKTQLSRVFSRAVCRDFALIQLQFSFVFSHYLNVNQRLVDMVRTV